MKTLKLFWLCKTCGEIFSTTFYYIPGPERQTYVPYSCNSCPNIPEKEKPQFLFYIEL